jgi:Conserved TM helix
MSDAMNALWTALSELVPRLIGAALVLFVAFLAARLLQRLATRLLRRLGFDDIMDKTGATLSLRSVGLGVAPSMLIGSVVF